MKIVGIIPARLASTRLPNKPLVDICGLPMIVRVWQNVCHAKNLSEVIVTAPDQEIIDIVRSHGGRAELTSDKHRSGTDRLAELVERIECDAVVNIQGDEPLLPADLVDAAANPLLTDPSVQMASLMCPATPEELKNPNNVKVVTALNGDALYFTRSEVPYRRNESSMTSYKHIGVYAYTRQTLLQLSQWAPTPLEMAESLEQLRALENGIRIRMARVAFSPVGVDTPADLERVRQVFTRKGERDLS
ncbi:MAG: 3-deoxy-manno-octulosonate cytidylyltransferase [Armatimonadota bacterium]